MSATVRAQRQPMGIRDFSNSLIEEGKRGGAREGLNPRTPTIGLTVAERLAEQASARGGVITFDDVPMSPAVDFVEEVHGGWDVAVHINRNTTPRNTTADSIVPRVRSAFSGTTMSCEMQLDKSTETALIKVTHHFLSLTRPDRLVKSN